MRIVVEGGGGGGSAIKGLPRLVYIGFFSPTVESTSAWLGSKASKTSAACARENTSSTLSAIASPKVKVKLSPSSTKSNSKIRSKNRSKSNSKSKGEYNLKCN